MRGKVISFHTDVPVWKLMTEKFPAGMQSCIFFFMSPGWLQGTGDILNPRMHGKVLNTDAIALQLVFVETTLYGFCS